MTKGTDMNQIENARANCRGSWVLGSACGKCPRCEETRPAIAAMPVQAEPVAWRYERTDGHFFLAPNRCRAGYPEADGWTETPLYAFPTPPAGGSDAE